MGDCNIQIVKTGDKEKKMVSLPSAENSTMDRISDDDDDEPSSGSETYEEGDLLTAAMDDDVTAQLAAAGWQYKHINGDFHFFAFHFFVYSFIIVFNYKSSAILLSGHRLICHLGRFATISRNFL